MSSAFTDASSHGVLLGLLASARQPSNAVVVLPTVLAGLALVGVVITRRWPTHE